MTGNDRRDGFTLMELVVVMAIFALVIATALPYAARSGGQRELVAFSQVLAAGLKEAHTESLATNRETLLQIDLDRRVFTVGSRKRQVDIPPDIGISIRTASGEAKERVAGFRFFSDGSATGGRIVLSRGGEKRTIGVNWLTGHIATVAGELP